MQQALNAVIYARYSSDRQTEQSIEGQLRECYAFAKANDTLTALSAARQTTAPPFKR